MTDRLARLVLTFFIVFSMLVATPAEVSAQGVDAMGLIAAVNELRASYDLEPYQVDGELMAIAQAHSEYQASINERTHTRADGTGPGDHGLSSENIGGGFSVSAQTLFNQWADYWHTFTLIGFTSGKVGAGMAAGNDGYLYYTLVVKNTGTKSGLPDESLLAAELGTEQPAVTHTPLMTSTPQDDGTISHMVIEGQTLWDVAIAYDMTIAELSALNFLDPDNPVIYPGQEILVSEAYTITPTATITGTPIPPTRTLRPSRTPQPSLIAQIATPTEAETPIPLLPKSDIVNQDTLSGLGIVVITIAGLGVVAIIFGWVWTRRQRGWKET